MPGRRYRSSTAGSTGSSSFPLSFAQRSKNSASCASLAGISPWVSCLATLLCTLTPFRQRERGRRPLAACSPSKRYAHPLARTSLPTSCSRPGGPQVAENLGEPEERRSFFWEPIALPELLLCSAPYPQAPRECQGEQ